jgi:acylphosphatase
VKTRVHVFVKGDVQGVFFRKETKSRADSVRLKGWVHNRADGTVEAVFEGEENDVQSLIEFCRHGPPRAVVTDVKVKREAYVGEFEHFEIRY